MTILRLILRSLAHYWQLHLGLLVGVAIASAVIAGSLILGDSVTESLRRMGDNRIGQVHDALVGADRFFTEDLAERLGDGSHAPVVFARGSAASGGGKVRVNGIQVLGVTAKFGQLSQAGADFDIEQGTCAVGESLAQRLGVGVGDTIVARVELPSTLSKDAPLSGSTDNDVTLRKEISRLVRDAELGGFKLGADQLAAHNVFLPLGDLQTALEQPGRANLLLSSGIDAETLQSAWTPADLSLTIDSIPTGGVEVKTDRVFLDPAVEKAVVDLDAEGAQPVLTYLINAIISESGATPNSMATATTGIVPDGSGSLPPAAIHQWLADDRGLAVGDTFSMRYFVVGDGRDLVEASAEFEVSRILPMNAPEVNPTWTPNFPGVSDVDNCRDWDPGFDVDLDAIRDKDEDYWDDYRGTPKVFLRLEDGMGLWQNRFGKLTSVRLATAPADFDAALRDKLSLGAVGIETWQLRADADAAVADALPLGDYFLYFSWFILMAALILASLLFLFSLESRSRQLGVQRAIGISPSTARNALLGEAAIVALVGALVGIVLGIGYAKACLWGLSNLWSGAAGALPFVFHMNPGKAIGGALGAMILAFLVVAWASRKIFRQSPQELLSGGHGDAPLPSNKGRFRAPILAVVFLIGAVCALLATRALTGEALMGAFFGAGALLLTAGLAGLAILLRKLDRPGESITSVGRIGVRNAVRRRGRSLAVAGVIASAVFLVAAVNAFRLDARDGAESRSSGTGGFAFFGESSLPVYDDLNATAGEEAFGFDPGELAAMDVVPMRTRLGEDASCLNLTRAQRPTLLGVNPAKLSVRGAFTFAGGTRIWESLDQPEPDGAVPAIVDKNTAAYAMMKKIGETLTYTDGNGDDFEVRIVGTLANSILQGRVVISEANFVERFPAVGGYQTFLIDVAEDGDKAELSGLLTRQLSSRGLSLDSATDRLAAFHNVQNSYLSIFTALGGLGVLIGTLGLGAVVARHLLERQGELGLLRALGFRRRSVFWLVVSENLALLGFGVLLGLGAALLAVWPQLQASGSGVSINGIALFAGAAFLVGLVAVLVSASRLPDFEPAQVGE